MATALYTGLQDKLEAAKPLEPAQPIGRGVPAAAPAARREIRTVLVAAHGWPTESLVSTRRRTKR